MFRRILVPVDVDDAETTARVLGVVKQLTTVNAVVQLVYVRPFAIDAALAYLPADFFAREEKAAKEQLVKLRDESSLPSDRVSISSPCGNVREELRTAIREFDPDLIVLGPHRPSAAAALFLGSTASGIVRSAPCSVLIVREAASPR